MEAFIPFAVPDRIAVDADGYGWRVWDGEDHWSMVPTNPNNNPIPEPVKWFVPEDRVHRVATALQNEEDRQSEFVNDLLEQAPEHYDDDVAAEAIALRYLRDLEAIVTALRPVMALWACDHTPRLGVTVDPECARCRSMGPLREALATVSGEVVE